MFHTLQKNLSFSSFKTINDRIFFFSSLQRKVTIMQKQINQISLKIALSLINDYVRQRSVQLKHIHQRFAKEFISKQEVDLHQWLLTETKNINEIVKSLVEGIKDYLTDLGLEYLYTFLEQCLEALQQNRKYLTQAIMEKINRKIDSVRSNIFVAPAPPLVLGINEKQTEQPKQQNLKRYSKQISRDLESLDYFLNLLAYQDNKTYQDYKSQCDKLLLQRQLLENIKPSQASKEIMETANMIDNVMENSDKIFQDSYILKYMEFKSFINDLKKPEELTALYKQDMENATKQKFKDGMNRTLNKCYALNKKETLKNQISFGVQTDQIKGARYQQKLQNLLIIEKKNNQKLAGQIKILRRNKSNAQDQIQLQKKIEREEINKKEADNKYKILQNMYNQKCQELQRLPYQKIYVPRQQEKKQLISISIQAYPESKATAIQTDLDFYYYFESKKIYQYKAKIIELQKELKHKQYSINQMEALRSFRDNFKSKKQIYQTAIRSTRKTERPKTLHYLDQDDQVYDVREEDKCQVSVQRYNTKKKVTLQELDQFGQARNRVISHSKKSKKKTDNFKNKPYFTLNSKIQDQPSQKQQKNQCQVQKVSIKSILKLGSDRFKRQIGIQTECDKASLQLDYVIQQDFGRSKIEKVRLSSRDKSERQTKMRRMKKKESDASSFFKDSKDRLSSRDKSERQTKITRMKKRESDASSFFKDSKEKKNQIDEPGSLRKSNFIALGQLNDHKLQKANNSNLPFRISGMNGIINSPKRLIQMKAEKPNYLARTSKWNQSKVITLGNQLFHFNNSLNSNFLAPISSNMKQATNSSVLLKNKSKCDIKNKQNRLI